MPEQRRARRARWRGRGQGRRLEPLGDVGPHLGRRTRGTVAAISRSSVVEQSVGVEQLQRRIDVAVSGSCGGGCGGEGRGGESHSMFLDLLGGGHTLAKPSRTTSNASTSSSSEMVSGGRNLSTLPNVPAVNSIRRCCGSVGLLRQPRRGLVRGYRAAPARRRSSRHVRGSHRSRRCPRRYRAVRAP